MAPPILAHSAHIIAEFLVHSAAQCAATFLAATTGEL